MNSITLAYTDNSEAITTPTTLEKLEHKVMELFHIYSETYHYYYEGET